MVTDALQKVNTIIRQKDHTLAGSHISPHTFSTIPPFLLGGEVRVLVMGP